jgi:hypothetical protein
LHSLTHASNDLLQQDRLLLRQSYLSRLVLQDLQDGERLLVHIVTATIDTALILQNL